MSRSTLKSKTATTGSSDISRFGHPLPRRLLPTREMSSIQLFESLLSRSPLPPLVPKRANSDAVAQQIKGLSASAVHLKWVFIAAVYTPVKLGITKLFVIVDNRQHYRCAGLAE